MKIFVDSEFDDRDNPPVLLSLGAVNEDGDEFYMENADANLTLVSPWVWQNVVPKLTGPMASIGRIANEFRSFVGHKPEFWAYYGTYDWYLICQLYGGFRNLPGPWPKYYNDLAAYANQLKVHTHPGQDADEEHHALHDARWNQRYYLHLHRP